jgi:hypothetical protein
MGYESIDPVIKDWVDAHQLYLYKEYKEAEVRSVENRLGRRRGYQIWIDEPDQSGLIGVHVWDFNPLNRGGRRYDFLIAKRELRECLESTLRIATSWIGEIK